MNSLKVSLLSDQDREVEIDDHVNSTEGLSDRIFTESQDSRKDQQEPSSNYGIKNYLYLVKKIPYTGKGSVIFSNGDKYSGDFLNGRYSYGKFTFHDESSYEGEIKNNEMTGLGTFIYPNKEKKSGPFIKGLLQGYGSHSFSSGTYYGNFLNDLKNGPGKIIFLSGAIFTGTFQNDHAIDEGSTVFPDGFMRTNNYIKSQIVA